MNKKNTVPVTVHILEKEYRIACPEDEQDALIKAAVYLNDKMKQVRDSGRLVGVDRIAVMTALNIVHEMLETKNGSDNTSTEQFGSRIRILQDKVEEALHGGRQLEL